MISKCDKLFSFATKRTKDCLLPSGTISVKFTDANVIHLIALNYSSVEHAGENIQKCNDYVIWHKSEFRHLSIYGHCPVQSNHFNKGTCKGALVKIQITKKIEGTGALTGGKLNLRLLN